MTSRWRRHDLARSLGLALVLFAGMQVDASAARQQSGTTVPAARKASAPAGATLPAPRYIADRVDELGRQFNGRVGIAVRSVDDNWATGWKADELYPQQSVSKLWVSITALDAADRGKVSMDDK